MNSRLKSTMPLMVQSRTHHAGPRTVWGGVAPGTARARRRGDHSEARGPPRIYARRVLGGEAEMSELLAGIDGWLHPAEAAVLHHLATEAARLGAGPIVEIGSWQGRSTVALATAARVWGVPVVAIDPHLSGDGVDGD